MPGFPLSAGGWLCLVVICLFSLFDGLLCRYRRSDRSQSIAPSAVETVSQFRFRYSSRVLCLCAGRIGYRLFETFSSEAQSHPLTGFAATVCRTKKP